MALALATGVRVLDLLNRPWGEMLFGLHAGILAVQCLLLIVASGLGPARLRHRLLWACGGIALAVLLYPIELALSGSDLSDWRQRMEREMWGVSEIAVAIAAGSLLVLGIVRRWILWIEQVDPSSEDRSNLFQFRLSALFLGTLVCAALLGGARYANGVRLPGWVEDIVYFIWIASLVIAALPAGLGKRANVWTMLLATASCAATLPVMAYAFREFRGAAAAAAVLAACTLCFIGSLLLLRARGWRLRARWQRWDTPWRTGPVATWRSRGGSLLRGLAWSAAGASACGGLFYLFVVRPGERQTRIVETIRAAGGEVNYAYSPRFRQSVIAHTLATALARYFPKNWMFAIEDVVLHDCQDPAQALNSLRQHSDELRLSLAGAKLSDSDLQALGSMPGLYYVSLDNTAVTDRGLTFVAEVPELIVLRLNNTEITDGGLAELQSAQQLRTLILSNTKITDDGLVHLKNMPSLSHLTLANTAVSDAGLPQLSGLNLETLDVGNTNVTDAGLAILANSPALNELGLDGCAITDAGLKALRQTIVLGRLSLNHTKVTDAGLAQLLPLKFLRALFLEGTAVTDNGVASLASLPKLRDLNLAQTEVTDAGILQLGAMPELRELNVRHTAVTREGAESLQKVSAKWRLTIVGQW